MAAVVQKEGTSRGIGFLRHFAINHFRTLKAASAASSEPSVDTKKPKRRKKKNLFEVAQFLPDWGVGYQMAKSHWEGISYQITKINLYKDGRHGKAWGIVHKNGLPAADAPKKISGVHKRCWRYIPDSAKKKSLQTTPKPEEQNTTA